MSPILQMEETEAHSYDVACARSARQEVAQQPHNSNPGSLAQSLDAKPLHSPALK